jgi:hypothetical protein
VTVEGNRPDSALRFDCGDNRGEYWPCDLVQLLPKQLSCRLVSCVPVFGLVEFSVFIGSPPHVSFH